MLISIAALSFPTSFHIRFLGTVEYSGFFIGGIGGSFYRCPLTFSYLHVSLNVASTDEMDVFISSSSVVLPQQLLNIGFDLPSPSLSLCLFCPQGHPVFH